MVQKKCNECKGFLYLRKREKEKNRKSVDINDRLICKYVWSTKKRDGGTIADRLAGGERKRDQK
jgi:ssDNA-binding Zn-finger/Zn-ribbon topoisomerase 1